MNSRSCEALDNVAQTDAFVRQQRQALRLAESEKRQAERELVRTLSEQIVNADGGGTEFLKPNYREIHRFLSPPKSKAT